MNYSPKNFNWHEWINTGLAVLSLLIGIGITSTERYGAKLSNVTSAIGGGMVELDLETSLPISTWRPSLLITNHGDSEITVVYAHISSLQVRVPDPKAKEVNYDPCKGSPEFAVAGDPKTISSKSSGIFPSEATVIGSLDEHLKTYMCAYYAVIDHLGRKFEGSVPIPDFSASPHPQISIIPDQRCLIFPFTLCF